eukprot:Seg4132.1 transcript_id=Seg4132.1/GoldUCD/mRNA.D3Y31 product="putative ubiquitin carboxyl-terminal hydrolase 8" protein_id=Seg4132.1/GoldUCD/D3Y31
MLASTLNNEASIGNSSKEKANGTDKGSDGGRKEADDSKISVPSKLLISVIPLTVLYWNEASVRLFHDICSHDVISWDATGKIVRSALTDKKLLYYELTARHPKKGMVSVPLSVMVTDWHALPNVEHWLKVFRHNEKQIFGSGNLSTPVQFNSDRSLVMILAALHVINGEGMEDFLDRAWRILKGQASQKDLSKMNVHACAFHFMRDIKKYIKKYFTDRKSITTMMWACSLLMNAKTLLEIAQMFALIVRICATETECVELDKDMVQLANCIEKFEVTLKEIGVEILVDKAPDSEMDINDRLGTEEEMVNSASKSKFRKEFELIRQAEIAKCEADKERNKGDSKNQLFKPAFVTDICKNLMPTAPLWSGLMLNDLSRHGTSAVYKQYQKERIWSISSIKDRFRTFLVDNKTIGGSERRMGVLYELQLNSRNKVRLDDFFRLVHQDMIGIQRTFADQYRSQPTSRKRTKKTVEESWDKKRKGFPDRNRDVGYYQAPPAGKNPIKVARLGRTESEHQQRTIDRNDQSKTQEKDVANKKRPKKDADILTEEELNAASAKRPRTKIEQERYTLMPEFDDGEPILVPKESSILNVKSHTYGTLFKFAYPHIMHVEEVPITNDIFRAFLIQLVKGLPNKHNNCWYNSAVQAVASLCRSYLFLGVQETLDVDCHPVACNKLLGLVRNLSASQASLEPVLEVSLKLLESLPESELQLDIQHDAHVFAMKLIEDLNTKHKKDFCEVVYRRFSKCFNCDEAESSGDIKENMIIIDVLQDGEENITSIQKGLDVRYADDYRNRMDCKCGKNDKGYQYVVMKTPPELAVVVKRYTNDDSVARKLRVPVFPSYLIDLQTHSVNNERKAGSTQHKANNLMETQYILRSVVTHHGSSLDAGHYTCCVFLNEHTILKLNDNTVSMSQSYENEELLYDSYMLFYERVDTVDMMVDSCVPPLMFCMFADQTNLPSGWKRSFPLRSLIQLRNDFLDQKITETHFHQLLLIAAREVYQRLPCDVYEKDFDVLTCLLLRRCVGTISLNLIGVEIVDCRECGSCCVNLIDNSSIHVNRVSKKSIQKLFEKSNQPCNCCKNVENVQTVVFDVPDVLLLKCDSVQCNDLKVSDRSIFNRPIEVIINRSTMCKTVKYRVSCVYLERHNELLMPIKERMIWWNYTGTRLMDENEHAKYLNTKKKLFAEKGTSHIILVKEMEDGPVTMLTSSQKSSSRTIEHTLSATFTAGDPSGTCESITEVVNETSNEREFVKKHSLDSTINNGMLSSDIIDAYMALIANESRKVHERNILVISIDKLMSLERRINANNFNVVKNNAKSLRENAFSQAITAYCIDGIHWIAMVYDFTSGMITYIDPLGKLNPA